MLHLFASQWHKHISALLCSLSSMREAALRHFSALPLCRHQGQAAQQGLQGARAGKCEVGLFVPYLVIASSYCSTLEKNPFFSFFFLLCCCSWQCMKVAEWCYMGCACKLQYNSTLQRCSISICYHKFISYFLSFIKNTPHSLYK